MIKINDTRKKSIFLGWECIRFKIKLDPVQQRGRDKTVFHPHSFNILYYNTVLKTTLLRNRICIPVFYVILKHLNTYTYSTTLIKLLLSYDILWLYWKLNFWCCIELELVRSKIIAQLYAMHVTLSKIVPRRLQRHMFMATSRLKLWRSL